MNLGLALFCRASAKKVQIKEKGTNKPLIMDHSSRTSVAVPFSHHTLSLVFAPFKKRKLPMMHHIRIVLSLAFCWQ
jgi:hypothetical protein